MTRLIRASEIGEYVFCRRAWWLRVVQGQTSSHTSEMAAGTALHRQHGRAVTGAAALRLLAVAIVVLAVIAALLPWLAR